MEFTIKKFTAFINFNNELRELYYDIAESQGINSTWDVYHIQEGTEMPNEKEVKIMKEIYNTKILPNQDLLAIFNNSDRDFRDNIRNKIKQHYNQ